MLKWPRFSSNYFSVLLQKDYSAVIYKTHYPNQLFVGCFPDAPKSTELKQFFCKHGHVIDAKFNKSGESIPFGFICIIEDDEPEKVLESLSKDFEGMKINMEPAVERIRKDSTHEDWRFDNELD